MIVRSNLSWFRLLFVWRGAALPRILPQLSIVLAVSLLSAVLRPWWMQHFPNSSLSIPCFALLGVSLAIFLGFRNTVSYERFWEARKLWGSLLITCRSLTRQALTLNLEPPLAGAFVNGCCAFAYALKAQLRHDVEVPALARLLPVEVYARIGPARFKPAMILLWLGELARQMRQGGISDIEWQAIDRNLGTLSEILGGCERISTTPIPFTYRVLFNRTVTLYCILLPAGLVSSIDWLTPPIAVFIAYTYLALERISEELEEPFGVEGNDLPLSMICHTIESSLREMQGQPFAEPAPPLQGVYMD
jgi:ion channel-forming bestrophin family protein